MSYRPITDTWILTRCKYKNGIKRFGGYLGGFPERARSLLNCSINEPLLHVCGGLAKYYPYNGGFGVNDKTMDLDQDTNPDILHDVKKPFPLPLELWREGNVESDGIFNIPRFWKPKAYLCDPPYSEIDAAQYKTGAENYPSPNLILKNCFDVMEAGQRVGMIHYIVPKAPKNSKFIACVGVVCGFNNRIRAYSVFEKNLLIL